ncbi:hypothetical protein ABB55_03220 [Prosthecomicrobium hirschii]|uniref:Uncharacterized protein n=1 Tax=Prosthecodimorpha hirschii TaxID=665126 RepID=A0A0P6VJS9_9HYPH|nr:hypothetical protein [Prosthecomicrobium hirschii]KPL51357.1 hypothetical protein ABB55_03220 [Prosthecomicrobium hirschii]
MQSQDAANVAATFVSFIARRRDGSAVQLIGSGPAVQAEANARLRPRLVAVFDRLELITARGWTGWMIDGSGSRWDLAERTVEADHAAVLLIRAAEHRAQLGVAGAEIVVVDAEGEEAAA